MHIYSTSVPKQVQTKQPLPRLSTQGGRRIEFSPSRKRRIRLDLKSANNLRSKNQSPKQGTISKSDSCQRTLDRSSQLVAISTPPKQKDSSRCFRPPAKLTYLVYNGNNSGLIKAALDRRGWIEGNYERSLSFQFQWKTTSKGIRFDRLQSYYSTQIVNHLEKNCALTEKANLLINVSSYCRKEGLNTFQHLPITFAFEINSPNYANQTEPFRKFFQQIQQKRHAALSLMPKTFYEGRNIWILKPTGFNRGKGIHMFETLETFDALVNDYRQVLKNSGKTKILENTKVRSIKFVVQKYIESPLLIQNRKFDIRVWVLFDHKAKAYIFKEGYLRTSSRQFTLSHIDDLYVHLTNNAIQKNGNDYGCFEQGNQLSYQQFRDYLQTRYHNLKFDEKMLPRMKELIALSLRAVASKLNPRNAKHCFEIFGYDFMLDSEGEVWLIEVNTNPCLDESSPLLQQLLPRMIDDALKLTVDKVFAPKSFETLKTPKVLNLENCNLWEPLEYLIN